MGYIYCIENKINHKKYIGKTIRSIKQRFNAHCSSINDGTVLHNAMKSYGIENFDIYVLLECDDELLNEKEKEYIRKYNTHWRDGNGYNMSYGGENSPDILEIKVAAYELDKDCEPILESRRIFKSQSEAARVLTKETGKEFTSGAISNICNGKKYSSKNYTFCAIDENNNDIPTGYTGLKGAVAASKENIKKCHEAACRAVIIKNNNNEEMYFNSIKEAERVLHIDYKTIVRNLNTEGIKSGPHKGWTARTATIEEYENRDNFCKPLYITEKEANEYFSNMKKVLSELNIDIINKDNTIKSFSQILDEIKAYF